MTSILDRLYASQSNKRLFFKQGWGNLPIVRESLKSAFRTEPLRPIKVHWEWGEEQKGLHIGRGSFVSPFQDAGFPEESRTAYVEWVMPIGTSSETPICIQFAATGDEGFNRRRISMAIPLAKEGIGSLILENPFYGRRRPPDQHKKMLNRFSDLCIMGAATVMEGRSLQEWLRQEGYEKIGFCGISMGGHMAAQAGALSKHPVAIIPCIAPHSPSAVFTEGTLKNYCAWDVLNQELGGTSTAIDFMRTVLDLLDIRHFPVPAKPSAAYMVGARHDAYISKDSVSIVHGHWPGSNLRWLNTGHLGAFLFHRRSFIRAVVDAFSQL